MVTTMFFYISLFIMTGFLSEIASKLKQQTTSEKLIKGLFICFIISIPAFFAGIRYGIGSDYFSYVEMYDYINIGVHGRIEPGYLYLNKIINKLGGDVHWVFFVSAFLTFLIPFLFLEKYKDQLSVGLGMFVYFLFFYSASLNIVRQSLAMSLVLYSFYYMEKKELWKFIATILISSLFHITSIIVLPFYILFNYFGKKQWIYRLVIYSLIFISVINYQKILGFVSINILNDSTYYLSLLQQEQIYSGIGVILSFMPYIILHFFYKKELSMNHSYKLYLFILVSSLLLKLITYFGSPHLNRFADYFYISIVWIYPYFVRKFLKTKHHFWAPILLIFFIILIWIFSTIIGGAGETVPYQTIFDI